MVWFNYRRVPAIALARQLIDEGRLGTIFHYDAAYRQQWGADLSRAATWRMDPALAGSGVADDLLTHLIDTALYLNGPIREGIAITRTFAPNRKVDDAFAAMVTFENGSLGLFEATRFGIGIKNGNAFQMHGSKGMLRFDLERLNHLEFVDATRPSTEQGPTDLLVTDLKHPVFPNFWRPGHIIGYEHTFIAALAEFLECLSRGVDFHPNFADGYEVQRVLQRCRDRRTREWQWCDTCYVQCGPCTCDVQRARASRSATGVECTWLLPARAHVARHVAVPVARGARWHISTVHVARDRDSNGDRRRFCPLLQDPLDDRRVALDVDRDQSSRSPDLLGARAAPARDVYLEQHAVRIRRRGVQPRDDARSGAGRCVDGPRRDEERVCSSSFSVGRC